MSEPATHNANSRALVGLKPASVGMTTLNASKTKGKRPGKNRPAFFWASILEPAR